MFKGFQERILGQLFRILLILHDAYNQDKYLLTVFIQKVLVEIRGEKRNVSICGRPEND